MTDYQASIQQLISRYLVGEFDASELSDRLPDGWDLDEAGDPAATDIALLTIGYLAGYQSGDRTEGELRDALSSLISPVVELEYLAGEDFVSVLGGRIAEFIRLHVEGDSSLAEGYELTPSQHPRTRRQTTTILLDRPRSR